MLIEFDIFRSATALIHEHGADADLEAAMRVDAALEKGDLAVCDVYRIETECPLLAISGHAERCARESVLPPKADIGEGIAGCPLMTRRRHADHIANAPCPTR